VRADKNKIRTSAATIKRAIRPFETQAGRLGFLGRRGLRGRSEEGFTD
jgi:hypothetical protein